MSREGFSDPRTRLHRTGHGFGLGNHEPPWIALGSEHRLDRLTLGKPSLPQRVRASIIRRLAGI